jgi:hypothetical protein
MAVVIATSAVVAAILTIIAGIVVLIWPKILNVAVGLWLLLTGFLKLIELYA